MAAEFEASSTASEREVFLGALEKAAPLERSAFLDAACLGNEALRRRVEALLREQEEVGSFLETPALSVVPGASSVGAARRSDTTLITTEAPGDRIGRYK